MSLLIPWSDSGSRCFKTVWRGKLNLIPKISWTSLSRSWAWIYASFKYWLHTYMSYITDNHVRIFYVLLWNCFWYMYNKLLFLIISPLNNKTCHVISTSVPGCLIEGMNFRHSMLARVGRFLCSCSWNLFFLIIRLFRFQLHRCRILIWISVRIF